MIYSPFPLIRRIPLSIIEGVRDSYCKSFHGKLFTLAASSESQIHIFSQLFSPFYSSFTGFIKNEEAHWFLNQNDILKVRNRIIELCKKDNKKIFRFYSEWKKNWKKYLLLNKSFLKLDLSSLSDKKLYETFKNYYLSYLSAGGLAYLCDSFMSTGEKDWLEELVKQEIGNRLGFEKKIQALQNLTSPDYLSFALESEFRLLKIAEIVREKFGSRVPDFAEIKKNHKAVYLRLKRHEESFYWIKNNYFNTEYIDAEQFYGQVKKIIDEFKAKDQIRNFLSKKENELEKLKKERKKIICSLDFSAYLKNLLEVARLFSKWKDMRKGGVYMGMHAFDLFLNEVSKRKNYPKADLTFLVFDEVGALLLKNKNFTERIEKRKEQLFYYIIPEGKYFICAGDEAEEYFRFLNRKSEQDVPELRGVVASVGYARGRVRIIRKMEDMRNFLEGEILVSNQTTPEYVPIMKKAAAIITEQGGITSHAAIVSREMKKPCIIGTKIATAIFRNGEMVEVDANNGVIRRINI
ncbi:MAG: PEP-utilizing enzyme [Candidatus Micrarchaeia archaeon]